MDGRKESLDLSLYTYMTEAKDITISVDGESSIERNGSDYTIHFHPKETRITVKATLKGHADCYDQVVIHRVSKEALSMRKGLQQLDKYANLFLLRLRRKWYHLFQKQ